MTAREVLISLSVFLLTVLPCSAKVWDVTELGAKADKETNAGPAIQAVIDQCAAAGGGTVFVPAATTCADS